MGDAAQAKRVIRGERTTPSTYRVVRHVSTQIVMIAPWGVSGSVIAVCDNGWKVLFTHRMKLHHCPIEGKWVSTPRTTVRAQKGIGEHLVASRQGWKVTDEKLPDEN